MDDKMKISALCNSLEQMSADAEDKGLDIIQPVLTLEDVRFITNALIFYNHREIVTFGFDEAIKYLKKGFKLSRTGWNGKKQYVELATNASYKNNSGEVVNADHSAIGNKVLAFVGTSGVQLGWLASQADMLAEDWTFAE